MPAQVPIEARKSEKGAGAESSPPATRGWSVAMWWFPTWASTRLPPGKVTVISAIVSLLARLLGLRASGAGCLPPAHQAGPDERRGCDHAQRTDGSEEHPAGGSPGTHSQPEGEEPVPLLLEGLIHASSEPAGRREDSVRGTDDTGAGRTEHGTDEAR